MADPFSKSLKETIFSMPFPGAITIGDREGSAGGGGVTNQVDDGLKMATLNATILRGSGAETSR